MRARSTPLRDHRLRLGLTQVEVAERLSALADHPLALDANAVSRHERGVVMPSARHLRLYARLYGAPISQLRAPTDPVLVASWDHAGTVEAATALASGGDAVRRRDFLVATGVTLTGVAHRWLVEEPGRLAAATGGGRITPELAGRLPGMVADLRRMEDAVSAHPTQATRDLADRARLVLAA